VVLCALKGSILVDVQKLKKQTQIDVDFLRIRLEEIAQYLYNNPELGSEEFKATKLLTDEMEKNGAVVKRGLYGMPTAWTATFKNKKGPKIALIAEYDALPGIGHGCGHNLIAAAAVGAGIAASKTIQILPGEIVIVGTPAEEGHGPSAGSKVIMANNGFWNDFDAAIMLHPANYYATGGKALGIWTVKMEFIGQTSHAAASPEKGINALNGASLAYIATHMLRQEARRDANLIIHGIISEGGLAMNIIPDRAVCDFGVRSSDEEYLKTMVDKIEKCAEGAATATGCKVNVTKKKLYSSIKLNYPIIATLWKNYKDQGIEIIDWHETVNGQPMASTDFGDVSQKCPCSSSYIAIAPINTPGHSKQLADASISKKGFDAMIIGTKSLAMTIIDLLAEPKILDQAHDFFKNN
jgi:amidohydrolase